MSTPHPTIVQTLDIMLIQSLLLLTHHRQLLTSVTLQLISNILILLLTIKAGGILHPLTKKLLSLPTANYIISTNCPVFYRIENYAYKWLHRFFTFHRL